MPLASATFRVYRRLPGRNPDCDLRIGIEKSACAYRRFGKVQSALVVGWRSRKQWTLLYSRGSQKCARLGRTPSGDKSCPHWALPPPKSVPGSWRG